MAKNLFLFLLTLSLGWGSYFVAHNGLYPVAMVNFKFITAKSLNEAAGAALNYYLKLKKPEVDEKAFKREVGRAALEKLIENELVYEGVGGRAMAYQLASLIGSRDENTKNGVEMAYGVPWEVFQKTVIVPQTSEELLARRLEERRQKLNDWIKGKKTSASVFIFLPRLRWSGQRVEAK